MLTMLGIERSLLNTLVAGSINLDIVSRVARFPQVGESIFATNRRFLAGGKGFNTARTLFALDTPCSFYGQIGDDFFGQKLKELFPKRSPLLSNIVEVKGGTTGTAQITVNSKGANMIVVDPGVNQTLTESIVSDQVLEEHDILVLTMETPRAFNEGILRRFHQYPNKISILNTSPFLDDCLGLLDNVSMIVLNEFEMHDLSREIDVSIGNKTFIVTRGASGVSFFSPSHRVSLPGYYVKNVVDTTGAGDNFLAGFIAHFARTRNAVESLDFGQKVAVCKLANYGTELQGYNYQKILDLKLPRNS